MTVRLSPEAQTSPALGERILGAQTSSVLALAARVAARRVAAVVKNFMMCEGEELMCVSV